MDNDRRSECSRERLEMFLTGCGETGTESVLITEHGGSYCVRGLTIAQGRAVVWRDWLTDDLAKIGGYGLDGRGLIIGFKRDAITTMGMELSLTLATIADHPILVCCSGEFQMMVTPEISRLLGHDRGKSPYAQKRDRDHWRKSAE